MNLIGDKEINLELTKNVLSKFRDIENQSKGYKLDEEVPISIIIIKI